MKRIKLTQGKYVLVDDQDYEKLSKYKWHFSTGYAKRNLWENGKARIVRMHHYILPLKKGFMTDHINGNRLDNRRKNLRLVTKSQNMMNRGTQINNTSGYKGVAWHKQHSKWRSFIKVDKKQISLGLFNDKKQAARAYNIAAKIYHKEYAFLNKI